MNFLYPISIVFLLFSCSQEEERVITEQSKTRPATNANYEPVTDKMTTDSLLNKDPYESPSGDWKVELVLREGSLEEIWLKENQFGKVQKIAFEHPEELIGSIDYTSPVWINNEKISLPNVGGSSFGFFELQIERSGKVTFIHHSLKKKQIEPKTIAMDTEQVIETPPNMRKVREVMKYSYEGDKVLFTRAIDDEGDPAIGCSNSSENFFFATSVIGDHFEIAGTELQRIDFSYSYSGGLLFTEGKKILQGIIKGELKEGSWYIYCDILLEVDDIHSDLENKKRIVFSGTYYP